MRLRSILCTTLFCVGCVCGPDGGAGCAACPRPIPDAPEDDADADGARDDDELDEGTDPLEPDTDGDGLADGDEGEASDPLDADTDDDGFDDGAEFTCGSDPADATSTCIPDET